jgi:polysaccharide biosynthesis transport protein
MSEMESPRGDRTSRIEDVARVVAVHKTVPKENQWLLPLIGQPVGSGAASYRVLRYRLKKQGDPRAIGVTSPQEGEGKTTLAANLALALAEDGRERVLLVEANFQRPRIAELFGFVPPDCFSRQLNRSLDLPASSWNVVAACTDNLHLLAIDPNSSGLGSLYAPAFRNAVRQLRATAYAFIVVDCAAVLGSADVNVIADTMDGLLFAAAAGRTRARNLRRAAEYLAPANVLGTVLMETH